MKHKGYNGTIIGRDHQYGYLNQDEQNDLELNWLTFRYRNYMPEIGRFFGVDPVSSEYMSISTYQFAHNNPVWKIEIEGLEGESVNIPDKINKEPIKVDASANIPTKRVVKMHDYVKENRKQVIRYHQDNTVPIDNCIVCHNKAAKIALNDKNLPVGGEIQTSRKRQQASGNAGETTKVGFLNAKGKKEKYLTTANAKTMDGSVADIVQQQSEGLENSVFGVSIADGFHTMTITVSNVEMQVGVSDDGTIQTEMFTIFTLSDQNNGARTFMNGAELDDALSYEIKKAGGAQARPNYDPKTFPAQVEVHQLRNN